MQIWNNLKVITPFMQGLRQIADKHEISYEQLDSLMQGMTVDQEEIFQYMSMEEKESLLLNDILELKQ